MSELFKKVWRVNEARRPMQTAASNYYTCDITTPEDELGEIIITVHTDGKGGRSRAEDVAKFIVNAIAIAEKYEREAKPC